MTEKIEITADRFSAWCDFARAKPNPAVIPVLAADNDLALVVAVWPMFGIDAPVIQAALDGFTDDDLAALSTPRLLERLWFARPMPLDRLIDEARALLGTVLPAREKILQAIRLGAVLPDGTIHITAVQFTALTAARMIKQHAGAPRG